MPLIKKYQNAFGVEVDESQLYLLDIYKEVFLDEATNVIKRINRYVNNELLSIKYFRDQSETESALVSSLQGEATAVSIITLTISSNYTIENSNDYIDGILAFRMRFLLVNAERRCWETLDLVTGMPLYELTEKFYENGHGVEVLRCHYLADSSIDYIIYMPFGDLEEEDWEYYYTNTFAGLQAHFIEDISYYSTAVLEPQSV